MPARVMAWNEVEDLAHGHVEELRRRKAPAKDVETAERIAAWTTYNRETMELIRTAAQGGARCPTALTQMNRLLSTGRWRILRLLDPSL